MRVHKLALLVAIGVFGCQGDTGPKGDPGTPGGPGSDAPTTGTIAGTVTDGIAHDALPNVAVTVADAGGAALATGTTGADGKFKIDVTAGPVWLTFAKDSFTAPGTLASGVTAGQTVQIAVTMNETASGKPSVSLAIPSPGDDFGYGQTVTLTASAADPNGDALTYTWKNTTNPALDSEVTGTGTIGTVKLPSMTAAFGPRTDSTGLHVSGYQIDNRFGIIPVMTDTRGQMTASLVVSDGRGQATTTSVTLNAASPVAGLPNVAVGTLVYVNCGTCTTAAWTITAPNGSTARLSDATSPTPAFRADVKGPYVLTQGTNTMTIYADTYYGMVGTPGSPGSDAPNAECLGCHGNPLIPMAPNRFSAYTDQLSGMQKTGWAGTAHAATFAEGVNGILSSHFNETCSQCHTTGYDLGVNNGGFDDAMRAAGWTWPTTLASTNWDNMLMAAPDVAKLANIQCESCHGPQGGAPPRPGINAHGETEILVNNVAVSAPFQSPRVSYAAEACGVCHAAGGDHIYTEWATPSASGMGHSNRLDARTLGSSASGLSSSCGRCHTAQGYTLYSALLNAGKVALNSVAPNTMAMVTSSNAEPITCQTCHDPHDATNPNQLRFYDDTPNLPGGFAGHGMGKGALCLTCHNSRNGAQTGSDALTYLHEDGETYNGGNPTGYSAPHQAAQGDVFEGRNAYFLGASLPMVSKHAAIKDTCVGCHMTLQPETFPRFGGLSKQSHLFRITDANKGTLCANCHGGAVDGEGIQANVEAQLEKLAIKMGSAIKTKLTAYGPFKVRAWDPATDQYSSASASNVAIDPVANPIVSAVMEEVHGQVGFVFTLTTAIDIPYTGGTQHTNTFGVQLGAIKDGAGVNAIYGLNGNFIRAGWNYFLIEGDQSKGLHNPTFANAVLNASLAKDLTN